MDRSEALCWLLQKVRATENVHKKYQKQLLAEKVIKEDDLQRMQEHISGIMSKEFEAARDYKPEVPYLMDLAVLDSKRGP